MKFIPVSLNSFYYFLSYSEVKIEKLIEAAVKTVVSYIMPIYRGLNIFIIIDDTLIPKYGTHFDCYMKHFDHCKRNNSSFLMGHSFVCICISIPVKIDHGEVQYLTIPVGIKLYSGEESKLKLSSDLIKIVMKHLSGYQVVLLCDSWYTKGEVLETVKIFPNLNLFGAVRADTALFEVPEKTSGRGRPRIRGERVDFKTLSYTKQGDYYVSKKKVMTRLFNNEVFIYVTVKDIATLSSLRLFIATSDMPFSMEEQEKNIPSKNVYSVRWNIEVLFYELKTFWSFCGYMVRNKKSIETYANLLCGSFAAVSLLPFSYSEMNDMQLKSPQEAKAWLADVIKREIILTSFVKFLENTNIYLEISKYLNSFLIQKRFL
jgi:hypothetical protein